MNFKIGKYRITFNVTSEDRPHRRLDDITIDTSKRDEMINELGINLDELKQKARIARLHRQCIAA